ncbi:unnamed protein product (macronuclear) [Paramecium tetraurelia]|uniref:T-complex protein 1 subunit gamma n=1 Tax=Paramecium tetraurelia TaxID=5888 RepID=A0DZR8_PARTE|nr:uncharacterized protein GSPATT00021703001 [Paramecium tetraurelia]CAK88535.1 unnamed protein product [Paramecium tetraurelia]|eukprot:XP_001455932.1 hypothetical protein (macronuclear) [Paramecium tetraurelia strain d4-2]
MQGAPVIVVNANTKREQGRKAQLGNIQAAKAVSDIVLTTLGPRSMLKMLLDPMGGIVMTNDGNAILREIDVQHPAAKSMIELARAQDEEVGDGTTSVIILAGEMMVAARPFIEKNIHPTEIVNGYFRALEDSVNILDEISQQIDTDKKQEVMKALQSCIDGGTLISDLSLQATRIVLRGGNINKLNLEIKRYAKVEKIPGGTLEESCVLEGVMINKDVTHPRMRREIKNPRIILLDCTLEYKKGESMTNMEMTKESDMTDALQQEINEVALMCNDILKHKPDIVITEKGVSDLAQHFLLKGNVSVIRRVRKTDNTRIARVSGATIVNRPEELQETDVGTLCGTFEVKKIGDDYFAFFVDCQNPTACSIILRGASKDVLNEMERNLHDCLAIQNYYQEEEQLKWKSVLDYWKKQIKLKDWVNCPYKAVAYALEIIPRTLSANCGADTVRILTELRAKHSETGGLFFGVDGNTGKIAKMNDINVWEPLSVKKQVFKTAIESACMLLRIDDVVSGIKKKQQQSGRQGEEEPQETFGDQRDG